MNSLWPSQRAGEAETGSMRASRRSGELAATSLVADGLGQIPPGHGPLGPIGSTSRSLPSTE